MSLICTISNEVPEDPVISPLSGCIYDRRLIEKYIAANGVDPVTGDSLTVEQLIAIKTPGVIKPRPPTATSIPALLKMLQDEWDACMLHSFTLRQQLHTARQELSHALYKHDAACRVIVRLQKEVTAAREVCKSWHNDGAALATLRPHTAAQPGIPQPQLGAEAEVMEEQPELEGLSDEVLIRLQDKANVLTAARKGRGKTVPEGLAKAEDVKNYVQKASHVGLHSASIPGITAVDIKGGNTNMLLTGGNDKNAVVFSKESERVVATFKGHQKKVSSVIYHPVEDICITASPDATIRIWSVENEACKHVIRAHEDAVTGISLHATGDYVLSASIDEKWAFSDLTTGRILCKVADPASPQAITCAEFHPDGLIFGTGMADSLVKIWDLKEQTNVANFSGHSGNVRAIAFSENGYYLASAAEDGVIKLWDLRKLKNFKTITLDSRYAINDLSFDQSGSFLAVAGSDVRVYQCKQWQELAILREHSEPATGVRFGVNASFVVSTSLDRSLKVYGLDK